MKREEFVIKETYTWELNGPVVSAPGQEQACKDQQMDQSEAWVDEEQDPKHFFLLGVRSALEMLKEALEHTQSALENGEACEANADGDTKTNHRVRR